MPEIKTTSGATATINVAPWKDAKALKKAIQNEIAKAGGDISFGSDAKEAIKVIMSVDGADSVDAALWPCLARCLYKGEKITEETFNSAEARKDYYDIVFACAQENLGPLVSSLFTLLQPVLAMGQKKQAIDTQKSESTTTPASSQSA